TRTTPDAFLAAAGADERPTGMTGWVAGRMRGGEVESLRSFGFSDAEDLDSLTTGAVFRFPAFTEVMVSALAAALGQEGRIDLDAPLSSVLTGLDTRLGAVSLRHLLSHQSGIDDAAPQGSEWSKILDDLDDRAIFTDPGAVYSYSRYDYPLAVRALVELLEEDLASAANRWVFEPVGMENTSFGDPVQGLPVLVTAVPDLLSFGSTWIDAQARNPASLFADSVSQALEDGYGRVFEGGLWTDQVEGRPRASLMCSSGPVGDAAAIQIFPESEVIEVFWSRARTQGRGWPSVTSGHLLETLASDLGLESDLFEPRKVRGDAQLGVGPRPCLDPEIRTVRADDPGTPAGSEEWAGRYMNGDRVFELRDREGFLWLEAGMGTELEVTHWKGDTYLATMAGRPFWPFRLVRDSKNLRYSVLEGRAHIHEEDGPGG
ncbi:MAG: beta-lactamase family protein, partial [Gemmatimonadetes bacterium]|nr:beta-lactamase family protein [Gemmatimonadota bacterium]